MLTNEARRKLMAGGMFGLPMCLVLITARMIGGPDSAEAGETPGLALATLAIEDIPPTAATPEQIAAAAYIATLADKEFGPTPFHHRRDGEVAPVILEDPEDSPVPQFTIKLIMKSASGNQALIGRKSYKVGDELEDTGWFIVGIDADTRSVSIRDPETDRIRSATVNGAGRD